VAYSAGTAYLEIVPSFLNLETLVAKGARDIAKHLDKSLGAQLGGAMRNAARDADRDTAKAAQVLGKTFADNAIKNVQAAFAHIPQNDRVLAGLRKELVAISEIDLGKGFDEKGFIARVERAYDALRKAQQDAQGKNAVGRFTNAGNAATSLGAVKDIVEAARKRGFAAGDAFSDAYQSRLRAMERALPDTKVTAASSQEQRAVAALRQRIQDAQKLKIGDTASADNNPLNLRIGAKIDGKALKREFEQIEGLLDQFSERFGSLELVLPLDKARQQAAGFFDDIKTQEQRANEKATADYLRDWQSAIAEQARREKSAREQAAKDALEIARRQAAEQQKIDEQNIRLRTQQTRREFEERARELRQAREQELRDQQRQAAEAARQRDRDQAQQLRDLQRQADETRRVFQQTTPGEAAQRTGRAAERIINLPVHLQVNDIDREMAAIRARIRALGNLQIGVDIDAETFADRVQEEFNRLKQIAQDKTIDIDVRVDAARAATELGAILVLLNRIDRDKAEVKVDTDGAVTGLIEMAQALSLNLGRLGGLIALGSSIGTVLVPTAAAAASAIGAIGTAALAAGSGIGVLFLSFSGISDAVKALGDYADSLQKSNVALRRSNNQVQAAQQQIIGAEMALANTRRNNAEAAIKAARAVRDAIQDQKDAVVDVARANEDAVLRVSKAQRDYTDAARDDLSARTALNEAYVQARRALQDLNSQLRGNSLDQRQATLDIAKAKQELDKLLSNPRASEAEREQADITYQQRLLQMDDLKRKGGQLADEQDKQFREGISQSAEVRKARADIDSADQRLLDSQRELTRAQQDQARTQLAGVRKLQQVEERLADARRAAADQQKDAAYAEFTATQSLISARRALANATDRDSIAGGSQLDTLNTAMAKLSPTAQRFARYIFGLRDAFFALRGAADPVLAGLQRSLEGFLGKTSKDAQRNLAPVFDFVHRIAVAIGATFTRFADMLKSPTFVQFFDYLSATAVPTIELLAKMFENVTVGVVNLFLAFTPLTGQVSDGLLDLTQRFRDWSQSLADNKGFQQFLDYMRESGPLIGSVIKELARFLGKLVVAAAPVGTIVAKIFLKLFELLNKIPEKQLTTLVAGIAAAATAIGIFALATITLSLELPGLIALIVGGLIIAVSALAGSAGTAGKILRAVWEGIKTGAVAAFGFLRKAMVALQPVFDDLIEAGKAFWDDFLVPLYNNVSALFTSLYEALKPSFSSIGGVLSQLGELFFWLYDQVILPIYKGILEASKVLFEVLKPVFEVIGTVIGALGTIIFWLLDKVVLPVVLGIVKLLTKVLGPVISFLWNYILKPILKAIGILIQIVAAIVKVAIGLILIAFKAMGLLFAWLYEHIFKPIWDKLVKNVFKPMGEWISKHVKPLWDKALKAIGDKWSEFARGLGAIAKVVIHYVLNEGILKAYNWLADKFDISPRNVKITEPTGEWYTKSGFGSDSKGFARGGAVHGPGTATSDSIPARLSNDEHVWTAEEVRRAGGHRVVYAMRQAIMQGRHPFAFAAGGAVGDGFGDWLAKTGKSIGKKASDVFASAADFLRDPAKSLTDLAKGLYDKIPKKDSWLVQRLIQIPTRLLDGLKDKVASLLNLTTKITDGSTTAGMTAGNSLGGVQGMMRILRAVFPGLPLNSGYRPGAVTVSGNQSYHALNRAVDLPPRRDVFEWLRRNYPNSRELIYSPMGSEQIKDGRSHVYTGPVKAIHWSHVHWAYDQGGLLPDTRNLPGGVMQVFHGRRTPDKVLTDTQWRSMATLAEHARTTMAGGNTYNFPYRNSTLDYDELNRWSARRDALSRVSRSNF